MSDRLVIDLDMLTDEALDLLYNARETLGLSVEQALNLRQRLRTELGITSTPHEVSMCQGCLREASQCICKATNRSGEMNG